MPAVWFIELEQKVGVVRHVVRTSADGMVSQYIEEDTVTGRTSTHTFKGEQSCAAAERAFMDIVINKIHGA